MKKPYLLAIVGVIAFFLISFFVGSYNRFVALSQNIDGQWAQVETQYQRRLDLIPNLVNSVKGVLQQEQKVFGDIAAARTKYGGATTPDAKAAAASELESALGRLLVVVENYPQLRSNETVARLMDELAGTENRISVERGRFNELVKQYNTEISQFPAVIMARLMGYQKRNFFQAAPTAAQPPAVDLNLNNQ